MERLKRWLTRWLLRRARSVGDRPQGSSVGTFKQESAQVLEGDARLILESITDGFCAISTEWRFIYVNRKAEALLRRKPDDLLGKIIWDQYPGLVGTEFEAVCRRVANTRAVESHTAFYPEHDRWYETRVYPAEYGISIYFRDVSEEKRADQQLIGVIAESERQRLVYETALSNSADFNYVFDLEGRFTYVNKALLALWEKDLSDALGKNFFELDYPAELAARLQQQITQVIDTGQSLRDETPYTSAIGTRAYEYIFVPVTDTAGRVVAVTGSTRDITERKQAEETLRENDRRKDEFLATLAHELRNPLAPLRNGLEIVRLAAGNPKALEQARSMMERQLSHLVRLVDDLLDLSRISRGKVELRKERLPIASVVQQAVELSRPSIDQASQQLNVHVPASAMWIDADPTRLTQVLANLLDNASKFTRPGGQIALSVAQEGTHVAIRVSDNGIGIATDMLPRVF
ncbi:MAG: PAS domain-containing sensor histidine kinase, partial [Betaproteobacteria bacterium]